MIDLLPKKTQYKANLHCHTVFSDGKWTPEQVKEEYRKRGYSVVAYTDHELLIPHPELTDGTFLSLYATEVGIDERDCEKINSRVCHLGLIALDPDNCNHPLWNRQKLYASCLNKDSIAMNRVSDSSPDFWREYSHEGINKMIKAAKEGGFFVAYNHPEWSMETFREYMGYEGMDSLEIMNYGCIVDGSDENDEYVYDEMLRAGKRVFCHAGDDNHNGRPVTSARFDSFGAWTMIAADKLEYRTVTKAMADGDMYASEGPEILYIGYDPESQNLHIECSSCESVKVVADARRYRIKFAGDNGGEVMSADFRVYPDDSYVRVVLTDKNRKKAFSRAYFLDEFYQ